MQNYYLTSTPTLQTSVTTPSPEQGGSTPTFWSTAFTPLPDENLRAVEASDRKHETPKASSRKRNRHNR